MSSTVEHYMTDYTVFNLREDLLPLVKPCLAGDDDMHEQVQIITGIISRDIEVLEAQLEQAALAHTQAKALQAFAQHKPSLTQILNPPVAFSNPAHLYTACMQMGFTFGVFNGTIHYASKPGEGMMDTTLKIEDLL